jgi:plasmid stabilization system protein ParE
MPYAVIWSQRALDQLTAIWIASKKRDAVTAAAHAAELQLGNDPFGNSLAFPNGLRELHVSPLWVLFGVDKLKRTVRIMRVTTDQPLANPASPNGQALLPS